LSLCYCFDGSLYIRGLCMQCVYYVLRLKQNEQKA